MRFFSNFRLIHRLAIGFSIIVLLFIGLSYIGVSQVETIKSSLSQINDTNSVLQRYAINFRGSVHDRAIALRDVILVEKEIELRDAINDIERLDDFYQDSAIKMDQAFENPNETDPVAYEILERIKSTEIETQPFITKTIGLVRADDKDAGYKVLMNDARPLFTKWLAVVNEFIDHMEAKNQGETETARSVANSFGAISANATMLSLAIGVLVALWIIPSIRTLNRLTREMLCLADGKLDTEISLVRGKNEVRDVADALQIFKGNAVESAKASEEKTRAAGMLADVNRNFEDDSERIVAELLASVNEILDATHSISDSAGKASEQSRNASSHAGVTASSVQSVAKATEELSSSIQQINSTVLTAAENAQSCSLSARSTQGQLQELKDAVAEVDTIVQSIIDVAEQTNLLALNATIEAARAGDAGKGFAVVAAEVKSLANNTRGLTSTITEKIESIKHSAIETISNVSNIIEKIEDVDRQTSQVSGAVQEQAVSTDEIARSINSAAEGTTHLSNSIGGVQDACNDSAGVTTQFESLSAKLSQTSDNLNQSIHDFIRNSKGVYTKA